MTGYKRISALAWLVMVVSINQAVARPSILLGPADNGLWTVLPGLQLPHVVVELFDGTTSLGPSQHNVFVLDSGATTISTYGSILEMLGLGTSAVTELENGGYQTMGTYEETGLAGSDIFNVGKSYRLDVTGSDGIAVTLNQTPNDVRILSNKQLTIGGLLTAPIDGIVGTPALVHRLNTLDFTVWSGGIDLADPASAFPHVSFPSSLPSHDHRYSVDLDLVSIPLTAGGTPPTAETLPFLNVNWETNGNVEQGQVVLDYGAQLPLFSRSAAFGLGLDSNNDGELDDLDDDWATDVGIGGVGGSTTAPVFNVESIRVTTNEGVDLVWSDLQIIAIDIDEDGDPQTPSIIDGVFAYDLLISGWTLGSLGLGPDGYFEMTHLDLTDAANLNGTLYFDLNPDLDIVVPEPTTVLLLLPGLSALWRRHRKSTG